MLNFISNIEMQQSEKGRQIFFANSLYQTFQLCISRHPELQDLLVVVPKIITGSHQKTITEISACIISHLFVSIQLKTKLHTVLFKDCYIVYI